MFITFSFYMYIVADQVQPEEEIGRGRFGILDTRIQGGVAPPCTRTHAGEAGEDEA